jgi:hypothetical protein
MLKYKNLSFFSSELPILTTIMIKLFGLNIPIIIQIYLFYFEILLTAIRSPTISLPRDFLSIINSLIRRTGEKVEKTFDNNFLYEYTQMPK